MGSVESTPSNCGDVSDCRSGEGGAIEWTQDICCTVIKEVRRYTPHAIQLRYSGKDCYVRPILADIGALLAPHKTRAIEAVTEWRQPWRSFGLEQYWSNPTLFYHAFTVLEIQGGYYVCTEKLSDKLELMFGKGPPVMEYFKQYRALGCRRPTICLEQPRYQLERNVTVGQFLDWINGPLAITWKPYKLLTANCQHYARDLQEVLKAPIGLEKLKQDKELVMAAVQFDGMKLGLASNELRCDQELVQAAVRQNFRSLQFALAADNGFVLDIIGEHAEALRFAPQRRQPAEEVRQFFLDAVARNPQAVSYTSKFYLHNHDFLFDVLGRNADCAEYLPRKVLRNEQFQQELEARHPGLLLATQQPPPMLVEEN